MNEETIIGALESILFMAGDAVEIAEIAAVLDIEPKDLGAIADKQIDKRLQENAGVLLVRVGSKLQLCTNPQYSAYVEAVLAPVRKTKLSQSLVETLSIVAYKQPITRYEIEQIRGVNSSYSVATLIERGLILRAGRKKTLGNPVLYITSDEFLRHFGLTSLNDLPELKVAEQS